MMELLCLLFCMEIIDEDVYTIFFDSCGRQMLTRTCDWVTPGEGALISGITGYNDCRRP
jgi:hypothetical protein